MIKKHNLKGIIKLVAVAVLLLVPAQTVFAATWSSSDNWGEWETNGYTIRNDIWGEGAGPQSIWANSESDWGIWSAQPNTGGIKSYPHAEKVINKNLSDIKTLTSNFNVTVPTSGVAMETTYDIWLNNNAYEVMLWMNSYGEVKPISYNYDSYGNAVPYYWGVPVGGHTWNVYRGNNGGNEVFSFVRVDGNISSGTVDLKEILNWIKDVPKWYGNVELGQVQFGYEITSSYNNGNGYNFKTNNFSVYSE
ncbi:MULTISPECIES: GH12 family glycosyl hydrolase domain-containing protein [Clostridium]|uniref:GH12 family glycosyl hydrolase domain-containing protein n=1 Tax=Clostridium TaxID=1485 RepID=UPI0002D1ED85|nr:MULTISPECIES: hypothetical protein [Clostridium]ENZ32223.1 hypothetical protein HMPREF1084_02637 [Clostridium butyricum 60E.3]MBS4841572.1 glycosyl hydrolase [Clostridium sp.]MDU1403378.1 glycosyl hydrolase [Clostridium sp.]MDU2897037.1 glycosyl hydrolase [Clostridium sp.]MDU3009210.1 glycosyl hydrolase [Clostridium sp.]